MRRARRLLLAAGLLPTFERDGIKTPQSVFHGGPVNGWNIW